MDIRICGVVGCIWGCMFFVLFIAGCVVNRFRKLGWEKSDFIKFGYNIIALCGVVLAIMWSSFGMYYLVSLHIK